MDAKKSAAKRVTKKVVKPAKKKATQRAQPGQPAAGELSRDQISEVMKILKDVGSVEIKLVAPIHTHRATIAKLGIDPIEAEVRQVYFFDTPNLDLNKAGVVVRARRIQGGAGDTVIKLRPVDPAEIDRELRRSESFKTEIDVVPGGFVCSGSFKGRCTAQEAKDAVGGKMPLDSLFSKEQRAFYGKHAPKGIALRSLEAYGPTFVLKARQWIKQLDRRLVVEMWLFPDGSRNLEISHEVRAVGGVPGRAGGQGVLQGDRHRAFRQPADQDPRRDAVLPARDPAAGCSAQAAAAGLNQRPGRRAPAACRIPQFRPPSTRTPSREPGSITIASYPCSRARCSQTWSGATPSRNNRW